MSFSCCKLHLFSISLLKYCTINSNRMCIYSSPKTLGSGGSVSYRFRLESGFGTDGRPASPGFHFGYVRETQYSGNPFGHHISSCGSYGIVRSRKNRLQIPCRFHPVSHLGLPRDSVPSRENEAGGGLEEGGKEVWKEGVLEALMSEVR